MKNLKGILLIAIAFFAFQSFTTVTNKVVEKNTEVATIVLDDCDTTSKFGATIRVYNRSNYPVVVLIDGYRRGWLRPGAYGNYGVYNGNYHVRTVWENGAFRYWDVSMCCGRVFNCYLSN